MEARAATRTVARLFACLLLAGCAAVPEPQDAAPEEAGEAEEAPQSETFRLTIPSVVDPRPCLARQLEIQGFTAETIEDARSLTARRVEGDRTNRIVLHYTRGVETGELRGEITDATGDGRLALRRALGFCLAS